MYKIVILGCENSHANSFLSFIKEGYYPEIEVLGIYSDEQEACEKLHKEYGVYVMQNYDEFVGKVDGIMITARHGKNHYKYAKPYLPYGIPMFIDKPITVDSKEAEEFMAEAQKYNVRFCGGSTCAYVKATRELAEIVRQEEIGKLVGGNVICPLHVQEQYGGFFFYAQHLVQIMTTIFGSDVKEMFVHTHGDTYAMIAKYDTFDVTATYGSFNYYVATVIGSEKAENRLYNIVREDFKHEMDEMQRLLRGGEQAFTYAEFIKPVYIMEAIQRSKQTGEWAKV